jgi:hypothetical protein
MSEEVTAIRKDSRKVSDGGSHGKNENHFVFVAERMPLILPRFCLIVVLERLEENRISEADSL